MTPAVAVSKAVQAKYAAISLADKPPLFADAIPQEAPSVAAVVRVEPVGVQRRAGVPPLHAVRATLVAVFAARGPADAWCDAVDNGGQPVGELAGLDLAPSLPLPTGWVLDSCRGQRPAEVTLETKRGTNVSTVYRATAVYLVVVRRA